MHDHYPEDTAVPPGNLVAPGAQPDYVDIVDDRIGPNANIADMLADAHVRAGHCDDIAAIDAASGKTLTFARLADASTDLALELVRLGMKPGDRASYRSPNVADVLIVMLAIWKAGGILSPIPVQAKPADFRHYLEDSAARFLFVHPAAGSAADISAETAGFSVEHIIAFGEGHETLPLRSWNSRSSTLAVLPTVSSDQPALLWHTGGTTGRPKGCYHTHRRYLLGGFPYGEATGSTYGQRWAAAAPIGHALGILHHTTFSLLHGATVVFIEDFHDPDAILSAIEACKITTMTALMASWARMAERLATGLQRDLGSLSRCYAMWQSASSSEVFDFWKARGVQLLNNFGSTSFATWVLIPRRGDETPRAALGRAIPGYRVEAVEARNGTVTPLPAGEIGQMAVKGPTGLTYWNLPDLQRRDVVDGWTLCDDLIQFDADGNALYRGRTDYMISTAGFKVAPVEVEEVLSRHPAVREVAVVPAPCPIRQQMVVAYIALRGNAHADAALKRALQDMARAELSSYKVPRRIEFVDALPRDPVGKVQARIVKGWASGELEQPVFSGARS